MYTLHMCNFWNGNLRFAYSIRYYCKFIGNLYFGPEACSTELLSLPLSNIDLFDI